MKIKCEVYPTGGDTTPIIVANDEDDAFGWHVYINVDDRWLKVRGKELITAIECCMNN